MCGLGLALGLETYGFDSGLGPSFETCSLYLGLDTCGLGLGLGLATYGLGLGLGLSFGTCGLGLGLGLATYGLGLGLGLSFCLLYTSPSPRD